MSWYLEVLKKYAVFTGRARRKECWMFVLVSFIICFVLSILKLNAISSLYSLAVLVPSIAVAIRRLHDTGRSGWWFLISFIPLVGTIILIVFLAQDSQAGENQYGPNPKESPAVEEP